MNQLNFISFFQRGERSLTVVHDNFLETLSSFSNLFFLLLPRLLPPIRFSLFCRLLTVRTVIQNFAFNRNFLSFFLIKNRLFFLFIIHLISLTGTFLQKFYCIDAKWDYSSYLTSSRLDKIFSNFLTNTVINFLFSFWRFSAKIDIY